MYLLLRFMSMQTLVAARVGEKKNKTKQKTDLQQLKRAKTSYVYSATYCNTVQPHQHISLRNRSESTSHHSVAIFGFTKVLFFLRSIASPGLLTLPCKLHTGSRVLGDTKYKYLLDIPLYSILPSDLRQHHMSACVLQ